MKLKNFISIMALGTLIFLSRYILGNFLKVQTIYEETYPPEVYFSPDCKDHLSELISSANQSIHCAFYDLDLEEIIDPLKRQEIDVKLVVDKDNLESVSDLNPITNEGKNQLTHNKFCIIDKKIISTGSFNPTEKGNDFNDNNLIIIHSEYLAKNYESEFQELWNKEFGSGNEVKYPIIYLNGKRTENYFCPEDSCSEQIIEELNKAKISIHFMTFTFTHEKIADELISKQDEGIEVKGVTDKFQSRTWSQFDRLKEKGIDIRWDNNEYIMHHKVFIIDNKTLITGSFNPTKSADEKNDENILIIEDETITREYLKEFDKVFV